MVHALGFFPSVNVEIVEQMIVGNNCRFPTQRIHLPCGVAAEKYPRTPCVRDTVGADGEEDSSGG